MHRSRNNWTNLCLHENYRNTSLVKIMAKKQKKNNKNNNTLLTLAIIAAVVVIIIGGRSGWFKSTTTNTTTNLYSTSNLYVTNTTNVNPVVIPPAVDPSLTCAQKAAQANAYYTEQFNTAKQCLDYSVLDCQDKGQVILGYAMDGTCCYYTCEAIAQSTCTDTDTGVKEFLAGTVTDGNPAISYTDNCQGNAVMEFYCDSFGNQEGQLIECTNGCTMGLNGGYCETAPAPIICHDSDGSDLLIRGTCHDNTQSIQDFCDGTLLREYYCESGYDGVSVCGYTSFNCNGMIPGTHCSGGICVI
jgi:hypothetical protein